jgi:glucose/arabinose dehydrogenase/cytochrome c551/c552/type 1 glutamine amidotransferase
VAEEYENQIIIINIMVRMKILHLFLVVILLSVFAASCSSGKRKGNPRVLVFSKTAGFRHSSIPNGIAAIQKLGKENGFIVDDKEDATVFNEDSLQLYSAVIFLNPTGDVLSPAQQADFERYIQAGGGFVGIHAATDCEYGWPWYGKLVGAYFKSHPKIQPAKLSVVDKTHPSTAHLPGTWERTDEWYNFKEVPSDSSIKVLIRIDEKSYEGGENGDNHPMAWYHDYDGGRAFYTEFGHTEESYTDNAYLKHILGGIQYAIGKGQEPDYSKAHTARVPDEDRFSKNMLTTGFDEPTEMAVLPTLDIIVVQRKGEILFYNNQTKKLSEAGKLKVYHKASVSGVNAEEGLMGIAADPDHAKNNFVYLYYSPADTSVNRLSRFILKDGKLELSSEKIVLELYSQRQICCHTGGSLAFGADGILFLSTGDNTTPFDQPGAFSNHGFAPIDQRPGFEQYDARRTSGNANDLRGKILRIKIQPDGTYSIPDNNLFKPGTAGTRPEIYVMGNRNPYRISVDRKTGFLYWGEVGPDAADDSLETRGPRGYDELNQARKAGFFGWPLFVGKNYPYHEYDYTTGKSGPLFDPQKPMNTSRNNTGIQELPPVSPAFIYYPYAVSPEFSDLGTGGRNAMAGPVFYAEYYPEQTRLPENVNGKLFFYDWMRGWIKLVSMDKEGNFAAMEPFMQSTKFNSPIDMELGPDGRLYILEYGTGWFTKNSDAALSRIDYNGGNRAPRVHIAVSKTTGSLPFSVKASAAGTVDPDKDPLTYIWHFGNNPVKETKNPEAEFTFTSSGENEIYVEVKDDKGASTKSASIPVYAGNETPELSIIIEPKATFYFPGKPVKYKLSITDKEDGSTDKGGIDPAGVYVKVDYVSGMDKAQVQGHQGVSTLAEGKNLVASLDCKTCHKESEKSIGPAYELVAAKYAKDPAAKSYLINKVIKGGGGVWGETAMSAHPDLKEEEAGKIADWILSLGKGKPSPSLPASGTVTATAKDAANNKTMVISASYTDKGAPQAKPLTGFATLNLRNPVLGVHENDSANNITIGDFNNTKYAILNGERGWLMFDNISLQFVNSVELTYGMQEPLQKGYVVEWYADRPGGTKLGEVKIASGGKAGFNSIKTPLQNTGDHPRKLYVLIRKADPAETKMMALSSMRFIAR